MSFYTQLTTYQVETQKDLTLFPTQDLAERQYQEYVKENTYFKEVDQQYEGLYYKIDTKEYKVFLTYCKPVEKEK